jgi:UDP-glucose 4-epimerase
MRRLVGLVDRGWPLPFGAIHNRRSFIGVDNLADFLVACSSHPRASGETLLIADGRDVSTPELIRAIAGGLGRDARLVPVPAGVLRSAGRLLGRASEVERLVGDLRVDSSRARGLLGWSPPVPFEAGILTMTRWYRRECGR